MLTAPISRTCLQVWSLSLSLYVMCRAADLWTSNPGLLHQGPWRPWVSATHFSFPPTHTHMYTHGQHHWHLRAKYTASDNDRWTGSSTDRRARTWEVTGCECTRGVRACESVCVWVCARACVNGTEGVGGVWTSGSADCRLPRLSVDWSQIQNTAQLWVPLFSKPAGLA